MRQALLTRFLRYIKIDTQSNGSNVQSPSTPSQFKFAGMLKVELEELGFYRVELNSSGYLTASVPKTVDGAPCIGFIAHLDTAPDFNGANINPQIIEDYNGDDILLGECDLLSTEQFPSLLNYIGQTLITTDGMSLLGGDDKAGIAEIITALAYLLVHPEIPHGEIRLCFTPDEEIGRGADHFDVPAFGAQWAYTIDGGEIGELEFENFNAATAIIRAKGNNCHPGTAYGVMVNAQTMAARFHAKMPLQDTPEGSKDYDGFFHLVNMHGQTEEAELTYLIRDFDIDIFEKRKQWLTDRVNSYNTDLVVGSLEIELTDSYFNMKEQILPYPHVIDIAKQAMISQGITPIIKPIRGGTDGARLSYMELPCPNIFTGGHNFHGKHEYICLESMEKAVDVIIAICKLTGQESLSE
ncbi:peptidase T [Shewanella sp. D64]|uniref:peptidase T n=1 Tax=unclassified Shewanella TaxID=196818 RepID=UPI0022BA3CEA|nr:MULTISPECIES: peptidase T [unclassified Shewanella]MEC4726045.1 peptidase T [Shewanella sp. D64]MEC4738038.1 peptidase T [Shewanella sp. E94]WBJ96232.1 peptidase T [Shewanella sp. MTB7]